MKHRAQRGFSLIELMLVIAIVGIAAALTLPSWDRMQSNNRAKATARMIANAFQTARTQAMLAEEQHLVMWGAAAVDACGTGLQLPSPISILADADGDCCIDAGESLLSVSANPTRDFAGLNWGVTFATASVPEDTGRGAHTTGSSFSDALGTQTHWIAFRNDGIPVGLSSACTLGQVGTGGGGVYLTNGGTTSGERDYAVVLTSLGAPKVYSWDASNNAWTN